jgi:hypothetical protein
MFSTQATRQFLSGEMITRHIQGSHEITRNENIGQLFSDMKLMFKNTVGIKILQLQELRYYNYKQYTNKTVGIKILQL